LGNPRLPAIASATASRNPAIGIAFCRAQRERSRRAAPPGDEIASPHRPFQVGPCFTPWGEFVSRLCDNGFLGRQVRSREEVGMPTHRLLFALAFAVLTLLPSAASAQNPPAGTVIGSGQYSADPDLRCGNYSAGQPRLNWAKFPAPPPSSTKISVTLPRFAPFEDIPLSPMAP
jgi:hypothetical protein